MHCSISRAWWGGFLDGKYDASEVRGICHGSGMPKRGQIWGKRERQLKRTASGKNHDPRDRVGWDSCASDGPKRS